MVSVSKTHLSVISGPPGFFSLFVSLPGLIAFLIHGETFRPDAVTAPPQTRSNILPSRITIFGCLGYLLETDSGFVNPGQIFAPERKLPTPPNVFNP